MTRYENEPDDYRKAAISFSISILLIVFLFLLYSCSSPAKLAKKAEKERLAKIQLYKDVRKELPCDTSIVIVTKTDTAYSEKTDTVRGKDSTITVYRDRTFTRTVTKQVTVVDSAAVVEANLNTQQAQYLLENCKDAGDKLANDLKNKDTIIQGQQDTIAGLKKYKGGVLLGLGLLAAGGALFAFFKIKSFFL